MSSMGWSEKSLALPTEYKNHPANGDLKKDTKG